MLAALAVAAQLTACLGNDDPHSSGFTFVKPTNVRTYIYANTTSDSLIMLSLGPWQISSDTPESQWVTIEQMKGMANAIYALGVEFKPNTTGKARLAQFTVRDTAYPDDAYASWQYLQHATRGDGSLGTAALVKTIKSSDQWEVGISYDTKSRPVQIIVKSAEGSREEYRMEYSESSSLLSIRTPDGTVTGTMDNGYQSERLIGAGDTIGYTPQYYSNGVQMSVSAAFNYVSSSYKRKQAYAYLIGGKDLSPDSLHTADSLVYLCRWNVPPAGSTTVPEQTVERYKMEYSQIDNRYQTVDVNQLLLGMENCEPLQLLSMFRLCRSTSIVKRATSGSDVIDVTTELNADHSVKRMVVKDSRKGSEVTYEFEY